MSPTACVNSLFPDYKLLTFLCFLKKTWNCKFSSPLRCKSSTSQGCFSQGPGSHPFEKWKWKLLSHVWLFVTPMDYTVLGILQAKILECVDFPVSRGSPNPGIEPWSPSLQADSLPAEPQGKPGAFIKKKEPLSPSLWWCRSLTLIRTTNKHRGLNHIDIPPSQHPPKFLY